MQNGKKLFRRVQFELFPLSLRVLRRPRLDETTLLLFSYLDFEYLRFPFMSSEMIRLEDDQCTDEDISRLSHTERERFNVRTAVVAILFPSLEFDMITPEIVNLKVR